MRTNRTRHQAVHQAMHRAMMAMAATGILTALAPAAAANADPGVETSGSIAQAGINTAMGDKVVQAAYNELNSDHRWEWGNDCNHYSLTLYGRCQSWCADFVKYVWKNAGVFAWESLDSEAGTTARYGNFFGTWHPNTTAGIYPGAAVTWNDSGDPLVDSEHVGIFVGWVNGKPMAISGNYQAQVYKHDLFYGGHRYAGWTGVG